MRQIIRSLLDNDLYKFTMQQAVLACYPQAEVQYRFRNRGAQRFDEQFLKALGEQIDGMAGLRLTDDEKAYLATLPFMNPQYVAYLSNFRFKPDQVDISLDDSRDLRLHISGPWHETILWEVPLMALISELYFSHIETAWSKHEWQKVQKDALHAKALSLCDGGCQVADFGTRRRRSFDVQRLVAQTLGSETEGGLNYVGTSNVLLAHNLGQRPIGTMAHEWVMGVSALEGLRHANRFALRKWMDVYKGRLGIALTDTFGTKAFWPDFDTELARAFDGVRHDSGNPFFFGEAAIQHYEKLGIDPKSKTVVFSDGLTAAKAAEINAAFSGRIKTSFGIGTSLTNDFPGNKPLNMVIKLYSVDQIPVVKLSDEPGKETGARGAVEVANWTFGRRNMLTESFDA